MSEVLIHSNSARRLFGHINYSEVGLPFDSGSDFGEEAMQCEGDK